jgi:hemerythrin superfamily protein
MDATQLLEQDHRKVESLFTEYDQEQDGGTLSQICEELEIHATVEEEIVYPRLGALDQAMEQHAEEEHAQAKELIAQIRADGADTATLVTQLQQAIQEHVHEEEWQSFPLMRERLGDELDTMGERVQQRKQQLLAELGTAG